MYSQKIIDQFTNLCIACGQCVDACPIIEDTALSGLPSEVIMQEILDLFHMKRISDSARTRIYSCLFCNSCLAACPQGLLPGLALGTGKEILRRLGDRPPKGVANIIALGDVLIKNGVSSFRQKLENPEQLITKVSEISKPVKTILFASCFGLAEGAALYTTLKILERIDPGVCVVGGEENCCGELQFMAGKPDDGHRQFEKLISKLDALSPEQVVMFCPTCKMTFDHHHPETGWSWHFVTDFIAEHIEKLGDLGEVKSTVTVHDPCHYVRGVEPATDSARKILKAIPGIKINEMNNTGKDALCCGAYAIMGTGRPGFDFRDRRLKQARKTTADILGVYCPGCLTTLAEEGERMGFQVKSILSILGDALIR